jgi:hypothetical protein
MLPRADDMQRSQLVERSLHSDRHKSPLTDQSDTIRR